MGSLKRWFYKASWSAAILYIRTWESVASRCAINQVRCCTLRCDLMFKAFWNQFDTSNIQIIANSCRHVTICIFLEKGPFIWNALFVFYSSFFWSINSHALKVFFRFLSRTYHTRTENYKKLLDQKRFFFNKLIV